MWAFGDLQITASAKTGPSEGAPVLFHWPWYWHLPALAPWLLLALGLAVPRANRQRQALLILVPALVLALLWNDVTRRTGMNSASRVQFGFLGEFLAVGLALLWLNADRLGRCRRLPEFAANLGLLLLADLAVAMAYGGAFPSQSGLVIVSTIILGIVLLTALTLTRHFAHQRYQPGRFLLWLAAWTALGSIVSVGTFVQVMTLSHLHTLAHPQALLTEVLLPGLVLGLCLYAVNLPYMLLMFTSPFFRRRFRVWLGAEPFAP